MIELEADMDFASIDQYLAETEANDAAFDDHTEVTAEELEEAVQNSFPISNANPEAA